MFRRTVGLNVEACDVFLDQVLHKRDAKMLCAFGSRSAGGGSRIHRADAWRAGAKNSDSHRNSGGFWVCGWVLPGAICRKTYGPRTTCYDRVARWRQAGI